MPCNSDYLDPTEMEENSRQTCKHIIYLGKKLDETVPSWVRTAAKHVYGNKARLEEAVQILCAMCKKADDSIIYNGKDKKARALADWLDEHKAADRRRNKALREIGKINKLRKAARKKLTKAEIEALGI